MTKTLDLPAQVLTMRFPTLSLTLQQQFMSSATVSSDWILDSLDTYLAVVFPTVDHRSVDVQDLSSLPVVILMRKLLLSVRGNNSHLEIVLGDAVSPRGQHMLQSVQEIALLLDVQHERQKQLVEAALQAFCIEATADSQPATRLQRKAEATGQFAGVPVIDLGNGESSSDESDLEDYHPGLGYNPDIGDNDDDSDYRPGKEDGSRPSSSGTTIIYATPPATPSSASTRAEESSTASPNKVRVLSGLSAKATAYLKRRVGKSELDRLYSGKNGLSHRNYEKDEPGHTTASTAKRLTRQARLAADAKISEYGKYWKMSKKERDAMWFYVEDEEVGHNANISYGAGTNKRKADVDDDDDDEWLPEKKQRNT